MQNYCGYFIVRIRDSPQGEQLYDHPCQTTEKDRSTGGAARLWALAALLLAVFLGSFFLGRYGVSLTLGQFLGLMAEGLQRVLTALVNWVGKPFGFAAERLFAVPVTWSSVMETIVLNIRMPRIIMACLVGCCLASAGACYQGVFQNPMAAPDLLGASTGACFGAALAILHGRSSAMITLYAFFFSLLTVLLVFAIGQRAPGQKTVNLILAGIMVSSLFRQGLPTSSWWRTPAVSFRKSPTG